jgi:hypothetical protein
MNNVTVLLNKSGSILVNGCLVRLKDSPNQDYPDFTIGGVQKDLRDIGDLEIITKHWEAIMCASHIDGADGEQVRFTCHLVG